MYFSNKLNVPASKCKGDVSEAVWQCCMDTIQVFLEDAGFDWKLLGPDVGDLEYVLSPRLDRNAAQHRCYLCMKTMFRQAWAQGRPAN